MYKGDTVETHIKWYLYVRMLIAYKREALHRCFYARGYNACYVANWLSVSHIHVPCLIALT
jgi:hypothetical protein